MLGTGTQSTLLRLSHNGCACVSVTTSPPCIPHAAPCRLTSSQAEPSKPGGATNEREGEKNLLKKKERKKPTEKEGEKKKTY